MTLSPDQFARQWDGRDSDTGYRRVFHDLEVPDHRGHEPSAIRGQARELGTNRWLVEVTHGPIDQRD